jgi:hypothetical protein
MRKRLSRPERDDHGTPQTSIRHHPQSRSARRRYAVAPIHTSGVTMRHVGPRDAAWVPLSILTMAHQCLEPPLVDPSDGKPLVVPLDHCGPPATILSKMLKFRYFLLGRDLRLPEAGHALPGAQRRPVGSESWSVPWSKAAWRSRSRRRSVGSVMDASVIRRWEKHSQNSQKPGRHRPCRRILRILRSVFV